MKQAKQTWDVDLSEITDCLDVLFSILKKHPNFLETNLAFDRNFMELLQSSVDCLEHLNKETKEFFIEPTRGWGLEYVESDDFGYDESKVNALRKEIISRAGLLENAGLTMVLGMEKDLKFLKKKHAQKFKKLSIALIVLSPFLYQYQGEPKSDELTMKRVQGEIAGETVSSLENLYLDFFTDYLCPLFTGCSNQKGYGQVHEAVQYVLNQFVEKYVKPATRLYNDGSKELSKRVLCIREVPKPFGIFRGMIGKDCSMVSIPFYALSETARVYWVWKGTDTAEQPDGYVFVIECPMKSGTNPYVVSINGPTLNYTDSRAVLFQIGNALQSDRLFVPSSQTLSSVVNTSAILNAMDSFPANPSDVEFPHDWNRLEEYSQSTTTFYNYYRASALKHANLIRLDNDSFIVSQWDLQPELMYQKESGYGEYPLFDRACIGDYALSSPGLFEHENKILRTLQLEEEHIQAIKEVRPARTRKYISPELFQKLSRIFGFTIQNLLDFKNIDLLANSLRGLFESMNPSHTDREWASLVQKTNRSFRKAIKEELSLKRSNRDRLNELIASKLSMPDVYLANYWEENEPYLFFDNGEIYHYRVHRYVRYFTSRAIIKRFLDFLKDREIILAGIEPGTPAWQVFFENAYTQFPEDDRLLKCLDQVFLKKIRGEEAVTTDYDYSAALLNYCLILGDEGVPFLYQELNSQPESRVNETFRQLISNVRPLSRLESYLTHSKINDYVLDDVHFLELNKLKDETGGKWIEELKINIKD